MVVVSGHSYLDGGTSASGYASWISNSAGNFYIYTANDDTQNDCGFAFTVIATSDLDLRQYT
jgi:hypothetical protein